MKTQALKEKILKLVGKYYKKQHAPKEFKPGDAIRYAGRVFDEKELIALVDSSLDFWLTAGNYTREFEVDFAGFVGAKFAYLVNSGSSANLLAVSALMSPTLKNRLMPGDEVITVAAGFPTTVNPIIQCGLIPVFVDVDIGTYNINIADLEANIGPKTRAIFITHTLGNPCDLDAIMEIVKKHNLWFIEDCCDALGSNYKGRIVGSFGHVATSSFYPAHHITMGEGGAVYTNDIAIAKAVLSLRDWGRDCWCPGGVNGSCGQRYTGQFGALPEGYDHKYVYSHIGYNLKATDMQAAIGVEQLKKLPGFISARKRNFGGWNNVFKRWQQFFILPETTRFSEPAWFAYPLTVRPNAPFTRTEFTKALNEAKIETRNMFAGNITKQPAYRGVACKISPTGLKNTDQIMNDTFFLGTYPGLDSAQMRYVQYIADCFIKHTLHRKPER